MTEKYKFLFEEEFNKLSNNIAISSTLNQSLGNFLVIQTFIAGGCFYLAKEYIANFNTSSCLYCLALFFWILSCSSNLAIMIILIRRLFSVTYAIPIFDERYKKELMEFIDSAENIDSVYREWFETYIDANLRTNRHRERHIDFFRRVKTLAIVTITVFAFSSMLLGLEIVSKGGEKDERREPISKEISEAAAAQEHQGKNQTPIFTESDKNNNSRQRKEREDIEGP